MKRSWICQLGSNVGIDVENRFEVAMRYRYVWIWVYHMTVGYRIKLLYPQILVLLYSKLAMGHSAPQSLLWAWDSPREAAKMSQDSDEAGCYQCQRAY